MSVESYRPLVSSVLGNTPNKVFSVCFNANFTNLQRNPA